MVTTTAWLKVQSQARVKTGVATIDIGESATLAIPASGLGLIRIGVPTIDTAAITFTVQPYEGATFRALLRADGTTVTVASSTGGFVVDIPELSGVYAFTIVTSAAQTSAARLFQVQCVGDNVTNGGNFSATIGSVTPVPSASSAEASSYYEYTAGAITKKNIKAGAGNLFHFHVTNKNAAVRWLLFHNKATDPAAADAGVVGFEIPAGTTTVPGYAEFAFNFGKAFATGIGWSIGTTQATFTDAATASDHVLHCEYL